MNRQRMQLFFIFIAAAWTAGFAVLTVGAVRRWRILGSLAAQSEGLIRRTNDEARELSGALEATREQAREVDYLQSLVDVLPKDKSFVRTQRAIAEEVETLRAKVGRRLHGELNVIVDTRANKLYVKKGVTLLWQADCSVGKGGVLRDKATGRRW